MKKFNDNIGASVTAISDNNVEFEATILKTKEDGAGGYLVTVIDQDDNAFDISPDKIKL